ncbi:hypothetical protein Trydic_g8372 [Trypoxylus dichotomus]
MEAYALPNKEATTVTKTLAKEILCATCTKLRLPVLILRILGRLQDAGHLKNYTASAVQWHGRANRTEQPKVDISKAHLPHCPGQPVKSKAIPAGV